VRETSPQKSYDEVVAGHSGAPGRLSQDIADGVRTLDRSAQ
jgi:hypothetical protein